METQNGSKLMDWKTGPHASINNQRGAAKRAKKFKNFDIVMEILRQASPEGTGDARETPGNYRGVNFSSAFFRPSLMPMSGYE